MKKIIILLISVWILVKASAQETTLLVKRLSETSAATEKIDIYLQLSALERSKNNTTKSLEYTEEALKLASDEPTKFLREKVFIEKALIYLQAGNTSLALDYAVQALVINEKRNDTLRLVDAELTVAKIYASEKLYEKALDHLERAISQYAEAKKDANYYLALEQKADAFFYAGKYEDAVLAYEELLKENEKITLSTQNRILQKLSIAAKNSNQIDKSIEAAQKSLALCEQEKNLTQTAYVSNSLGYLYRQKKDFAVSTQYFEKALQNLKAIDKKDYNVLNNMGVTCSNLGKHSEAKKYYVQAIEVAKDNPEAYANSQNYLAVNHYAVGNYRQALQEVQKAIEVATANQLKEPLAESYLVQYEIYNAMKDLASAQQAYQNYLSQKEELEKAQNRQNALLQQKRLAAEQKESQIRLAINEQEKQEIEFQRLRLEKEKKDAEIAAASKNLALLAKEAELKESKLKNQALEKERAEQALKIAQKELEEEKKQRQLEELKQKQELQELALKQQELEKKEQQKALELLKKEQELKEREAEEERFKNRIFYIIGLIVLVALLYVTYLLVRVKKQSRLIKEQTQKLDVQNQALKASEEELRQNLEELQVTQEMLQKQKGELEKALETTKRQQKKIEERNREIADKMAELKATQEQLIQAEKMATLGQLVANIAHEINTPLGAVRSSSNNIQNSLEALPQLSAFLQTLSKEQLEMFNSILAQAASKDAPVLSTREKRTIKYNLIEKLEKNNVKNADGIADYIVDMNIHEQFEAYLPQLTHEKGLEILSMASRLSSIVRSNKNIQLATERASKVIFALKNFSRQDHTGEKQPTKINQNIDTTLIIYENLLKQGIEVKKEFAELPDILAYPDELVQVWTNLIHNSIQAMKGKGLLEIKTSQQNGAVLVSIRDTGGGIPAEIRDKIFTPFFTTKKAGEGSGLGLDIARKIVQKHNGEIWFDVEDNVGTTFFVKIPITLPN